MEDTYDDGRPPVAEAGSTHAAHLVVLLECDRPLASGARYALDNVDQITIGRGDARTATRQAERGLRTLDVRLPGRSVSAVHARLVRVGPSWAVEDLGSRNGTFVNGERVSRAVLEDHDVFETGHALMRINPSAATPAGSPRDLDTRGDTGPEHVTLDPAFAADLERAAILCRSGVPVVLVGESGTGKEVLARWLHKQSGRTGDLVAVNCGAIPATLLESQLFGHMKGAFSGAVRDEPGLVRAASGGTLFLDEIADLPKSSQAALLRVLQEAEVLPVGATRAVKVDLRFIAATQQPLEHLVEKGDFRRDLFARVGGFSIALPSLRDRWDDLGILIATLLERHARGRAQTITLAPEVGRVLLSYGWPLNIRELERCVATFVALTPDGRIQLAHLPRSITQPEVAPRHAASGGTAQAGRDDGLRLKLLELLSSHRGNLAAVARDMGKAPMQVHRWCKRFGIEPRLFRG